jgi:hypothetical protein
VTGHYIFTYIIFKIVDILRMMKFDEFFLVCFAGTIYIEFAIYIKTFDEGMSHGNPSGFHGMVFVVVKLANFLIKEVGYILSILHLYSAIYY